MATVRDTMGEEAQRVVHTAENGLNKKDNAVVSTGTHRSIDYLPNELKEEVLNHCHGGCEILSFAYTCRRFYNMFATSGAPGRRVREWTAYRIILRFEFFFTLIHDISFHYDKEELGLHMETLKALLRQVEKEG